MDRLDAMSVLLAVVEAGSLSGAGRTLRVPLSTVSRKIADLEAHLGARLLVRSNRRVSLTEAGRSYAAASKRILAEVSDAERAAAGEYASVRGELVITAPVVFGRLHMLPVVAAFLAAHPDITIRFVLADRIVHLVEDHVDLALRIGTLPDSSLVATKLGAIRRVVCGSPDYLSRRGRPLVPDDLTAHDCVTFSGLEATDTWLFPEGRLERAVAIRSRLAVNTAEAAIDAAVAGLGLTRVLSYQVAAALRSGQLQTVLDACAPPPVSVSLVYNGQGLLPQKLRAFLDFAAPRLRAVLTEGAGQGAE
jgi:DNA-binding transcriptional LysR family regulator